MGADGGLEGVRTGLRGSRDPRTARTRASLFEAAVRLSAAGEPISVSTLTRAAGVSRSAFYTHFSDLGALALRLLEPQFAVIAERASVERADDPHGSMLRAQQRLVAHFEEHASLYRAAFQLPGHQVAERVAGAIRGRLEEHVEAIGAPEGIRADLAARYISSAATHVIEQWVLGNIDAGGETVARHLLALMPAWMHEHDPPSASDCSSTHQGRETP